MTGANPLVFDKQVILTGTSAITYAAPQTGVNVSFDLTIDGTTAGLQGLSVDAGTGTVTFEGLVGNNTPLASLGAGLSTGITIPTSIITGSTVAAEQLQ